MNGYLTEMGRTEAELCELLPYRLASAAIKCAAVNHVTVNEVRLREGQPLCITSGGRNIRCARRVTREDIDSTVRHLCSNSLYSHADTIRDGYITARCGVRAGICGKAVTDGGVITAVTDISSICLRFPVRVPNAADGAYSLLKRDGFSKSLLVYSRPCVGKTTLLRELAYRMATGDDALRIAIVDTRSELSARLDGLEMADVLLSYPRGKGIEIALRTLSPEYILCDEIGSAEEADAIMEVSHSGVSIAASAHGGSFEELMRCPYIRTLWENGIFGICLGLLDRDEYGGYVTEISYFEGADEKAKEYSL